MDINSRAQWKSEDIELLRNDYLSGKSKKELSVKYGRSKNAIKAALTKFKIKPSKEGKKLFDLDFEVIKSLYENGKPCADIAKLYGCSGGLVNYILINQKHELRNSAEAGRKYPINHNYFDEIDSEEKAYFLGFLYADGYNNEKNGKVVLTLQESDKEILLRLKDLLQPTKHLRLLNNNGFGQCVLEMCSKHISTVLANYGCVQAKSFIVKFPDFIKEDLLHHFIRGYFDGDGSVFIRKEKYPSMGFSIVGSIPFIEKLQEILIDRLKLSTTKLNDYDKVVEIRYCGNIQVSKILNYLYKDATIFLQRKHDKFLEGCRPRIRTHCKNGHIRNSENLKYKKTKIGTVTSVCNTCRNMARRKPKLVNIAYTN